MNINNKSILNKEQDKEKLKGEKNNTYHLKINKDNSKKIHEKVTYFISMSRNSMQEYIWNIQGDGTLATRLLNGWNDYVILYLQSA